MKLNTVSYFAGVGTVVAALTVGFGGALLIVGPSHQNENRNRVQQVMAHPPASPIAPAVKTEALVATDVTPAASEQPSVYQPSPEPTLGMAKVELPAASKSDPQRNSNQESETVGRIKLREVEVKHAVDRENQRKWAERKRRQEIAAATISVKRMLQDNRVRQIVQLENNGPARFGFFGN